MRRAKPFLVASFALSSSALAVSQARAHHTVGHAASESSRTLLVQGTSPLPRQRATLVGQIARSSDEPTLNVATAYSVGLLAEVRIVPRLYVNAYAPLVLVDEDAVDSLKFGYGDTSLGVTVPVGRLEEGGSTQFALGASVGVPTRTMKYEVDPGRQWLFTGSFRYADSAGGLHWYAQLLTPVEVRPAGTALDVSPAVGVGHRLPWKMTAMAGIGADIRVLNVCRTVDGTETCPDGRATESERSIGTTRAYVHAVVARSFGQNWSVFVGGQLPITAHRDIEWSANVGVEARF